MYGEAFAANFVDPLEIGNTIPVNPWFPLVTGNHWLYLGDGESIEVTVTDETKLIDGVTCVVVIDVASEDGEVVEITQDWYAQDVAGNVWYCGEIARNFELFPGDDPETPEVVDIEGSWKAGRDGAEPGILLPFDPQVGDVFRQEVAYGEAEDAVEILSITADEVAPGGACASNCLMTSDFTPLEPDVEENKYYVPGIGLIVEIDPDTGATKVVRYTTAQDAGTAIHPSYVEGQMQGGVAQGVGWALNEEYIHNADGTLDNPSFLDYRMPVASDLPMIETIVVEVPNPAHPYGVRGVGEVGIVPPLAAVANAVADATGKRMRDLPISPPRLLEALQNGD